MQKKKKQVNDFERSSIAYFNDISKCEGLSREEEYELWSKYKYNNDIAAGNKLVEANLKFVASVAKTYQGRGLSYADLIAEGNYGLMKALEKFDGEKGNKFISYAVWWIKQSILEALKNEVENQGTDLPCDYENQQDCYDDNDESEQTESKFSTYVSDDTENMFREQDVKNAVQFLTSCLDERERLIINEHFGIHTDKSKTLQEIGDMIGLTKERVRQINDNAIKKLRAESLNNCITADIYR